MVSTVLRVFALSLVSGCAVIDGVTGGGETCTANQEICSYCEQHSSQGGCGTTNIGKCGQEWVCVRGDESSCGSEYSQMLDYFRANPDDCFNTQLSAVVPFLQCQGNRTLGGSCFD